jgi:hypothetical protein
MTKVTVDPTLRAKLNGLNTQIEICDESGRTLGLFVPAGLYQQLLSAWSQCPYTDEEMDRHMAEPGGRPLDAIWKQLGRK